MTSSWFFLSTLNYDARTTTHQINILSVGRISSRKVYQFAVPAVEVKVTAVVEGIIINYTDIKYKSVG